MQQVTQGVMRRMVAIDFSSNGTKHSRYALRAMLFLNKQTFLYDIYLPYTLFPFLVVASNTLLTARKRIYSAQECMPAI